MSPIERPTTKAQRRALEEREKYFQFEKELGELQDRIGYQFKNQDLLKQAFTSPDFAHKSGPGTASNRELEARGDAVLKNAVQKWIDRFVPRTSRTEIAGWLNSNLYLSAVGVHLELDRCVRLTKNRSIRQKPEARHRMTADCTEALIGAIKEDGGEEIAAAFIETFILPEPTLGSLIADICDLTSGDLETVQAALARLTRNRGELVVRADAGGSAEAEIIFDGKVVRSDTGNSSIQAARYVIDRFFKGHAWILWGFDEPVSLRMPRAHPRGYGIRVRDQLHKPQAED